MRFNICIIFIKFIILYDNIYLFLDFKKYQIIIILYIFFIFKKKINKFILLLYLTL